MGPTFLDFAGFYMFKEVKMVKPYHHTELELVGCLG